MSMTIAQQMQQLYSQYGGLAGISIELHKNLLAVRVDNHQASATVFLQGAQISHYQRHNQHPVLWCSPQCDYQQGHSLRAGIPVCWPWFGDLSRNPRPVRQHMRVIDNAPAHGFVRNRLWQLTNVDLISNDLTQLQLSLTVTEDDDAFWPHACLLQLTITIGNELCLHLHIKNLSHENIAFSNALHSYFAVSDIDQITINGLDQLNYIDCMDNWKLHTQQGAVSIGQEVDRIYKNTQEDITLIDPAWKRVINVLSKGSNSAVIWNPWCDKSKRLSQFDDQAYKEMLCIETANADEDYVQLAGGEHHQLEVHISEHLLS